MNTQTDNENFQIVWFWYTPTFTPTPTSTATNTSTSTPTVTPTFTNTPTPTNTFTPTPTDTNTLVPTWTSTTTPSPTNTPTSTNTSTSTPEPTTLAERPIAHVPILMYHFISIPPENADIYQLDLSVSPELFREQLAYLKAESFTTISLTELLYHLSGHASLPEKPIVLTLDDGYVDNYTIVFPLLKEFGFKGTFFIVTEPIDFNDQRYMSWDNIIEMHNAGMEFGSHTRRHRDLRNLSESSLIDEILGSRMDIEARIHAPVHLFCYPSGRYNDYVLDFLQREDFWLAVTTSYGYEHSHDNRFELTRIRMSSIDTLETFKAKLSP